MCGIIGRVSAEDVVPHIISGLKRLEYRGYDSGGIAFFDNDSIKRIRSVGKISQLEKLVNKEKKQGFAGIGHTRWATHGKPTESNAHPHKSTKGTFYIVHNGIIENSEEIKKSLLTDNVVYESQTDSEIFAHLLEKFYEGDPVSAIAKALAVLKGSYAFGVLCKDFPNTIFGASSGSPLVAIKGEGGCSIASDIGAVAEKATEIFRVYDGEICKITQNNITFFDLVGKKIKKRPENAKSNVETFEKEGYSHFMLKEIEEQPEAVNNTIKALVSFGSIALPDVTLDDDFIAERLQKIAIVACGSAYHTGLVAKHVIEELAGIPCTVEIASEFRYSQPLIDESTLVIFVSQSGETADTLASLRLAKHCGAQILSIVNVKESAIARESENVIFTEAGREIAVATTKAYSAQLVAFYALGIYFGRVRGNITYQQEEKLVSELLNLPQKIEETLQTVEQDAKELAKTLCNEKDVFFIGRLTDYATACEGSLKLKEISYINAQSYAAGELKHGTISLVEANTPVIAIAGESKIFSKTVSNICEVEARGARVFVITDRAKASLVSKGRKTIFVPDTISQFRSSLLVIPLQLISYYAAFYLDRDIDKPKNLAKSVTVE